MYVLKCKIVPFPLTSRVIVKNLARELYAYRPETAERRLRQHLDFQRRSMVRKGIAPKIVEREIGALERAVRAALWQIQLYGGDAA